MRTPPENLRRIALGLLLAALAAPLDAVPRRVEVEGVRRELERNIRSVLSLEQEEEDHLTEERIRRLHSGAAAEIAETGILRRT